MSLNGVRTRNIALLDDLLHENSSIKDSLFVSDVLVQVVLLLVKMKKGCEANDVPVAKDINKIG